jgi:hypothetical protein
VRTFLDSKTSKTFVRGMLKMVSEERAEASVKFEGQTIHANCAKFGKRKQAIEQIYAEMLQATLLGFGWVRRTLIGYGLHPITEEGRPTFACLMWFTYNARTNVKDEGAVIDITTHALERMLERQPELNLIRAARSELTAECIESMVETFSDYHQKGELEERSFKVDTRTGTACCIVKPGEVAVMTTWYRREPPTTVG